MKNYKRNFKKRVYTDQRILQKMRNSNIIHFLVWYDDELITYKNGSFRLADDTSIVLFNNLAFDYSAKVFSKSVNTLDFVCSYLCKDDFNKARIIMYYFLSSDKNKLEELAHNMLLSGSASKNSEDNIFPVDKDSIFNYDKSLIRWIYGYLHNERKICRYLIAELMKRKLLAIDAHKNILFLTYDDNDEIISIEKKGTYINKRFAQTKSMLDAPFIYMKENAEEIYSLYVFESTIDLLSYLTLNETDEQAVYISLRGAAKTTCIYPILQQYKDIDSIFVCGDNDSAGTKMFESICTKYNNKYVISPDFPPLGKDWNEHLIKTVSE